MKITGPLREFPNLGYTNNGKAICKINIGTHESSCKVILWGKAAENFSEYCFQERTKVAAGQKLSFEGYLSKKHRYAPDGKQITENEFHVNEWRPPTA